MQCVFHNVFGLVPLVFGVFISSYKWLCGCYLPREHGYQFAFLGFLACLQCVYFMLMLLKNSVPIKKANTTSILNNKIIKIKKSFCWLPEVSFHHTWHCSLFSHSFGNQAK